MNTFAKSCLSLALGLGLCAGAQAQSAPADAHKSPVKVESPKHVTKAEAPKATKAPSEKPVVSQKSGTSEAKTVKEHKPVVTKEAAHPAVAPTAAKVLPKTDQPAKPAK